MKLNTKSIALAAAILLLADRGLSGCGTDFSANAATPHAIQEAIAFPSPTVGMSYADASDGGHAIFANKGQTFFSNITVRKTGSVQGDKADFYGENAAVLAVDGAALTLREASVSTEGEHANAVFSYGEDSVVDIADSTITTLGDFSGGLMTTGGGTMNAANLVIRTSGRSSAAIRSDRGGGTVRVSGGTYSTDGVGSPAVYSTADISVKNAELVSRVSQAVVIEGDNSVQLENVTVTANNTEKNSGKSPWYQAVMLYQSMSGDSDEGSAEFTMLGGSLTSLNGDVFFVSNTLAVINLTGAEIMNDDPDGVFLRAAAAGWGREGQNGGHVELRTAAQKLEGDILADKLSTVSISLADGSVLTGAVNPSDEGEVSITLTDGARWSLTGDSHVKSLNAEGGSIQLNGYILTVDGTEYKG